MNFKSFYNILTEDANSTKAEIFNNIIRKELGFQIFKNKNKQENADAINELRNKWNPIISSLEEIVKKYNPKDKNLSDLKDLIRLYEPNMSISIIDDDYKNYVKNQSLTNKKILQSSSSYIDFAEKVHSEMKGDESKIKVGSSEDPNKVYEDDEVIVFLANTGDPVSSENNCKIYGKGTSLCISGSSSSHYYNYYRWENELTTYFVWLKSENRYILVDAYNDNGVIKYSYNNVKNNSDIKSTKDKIISIYPSLSEAFNRNVFIPVPIEGKEKEIYEKLYNVKSILELKNIEDMILFASIKDVDSVDLYKLSKEEQEAVLKVLAEKENDLPHDLLEKFPTIKNRYWKKREINVLRELEEWNDEEDEEDFTNDEYYIISKNKDLKDLLILKIPKYREIFSILYNLQQQKNLSSIYWQYKYPLSLPNLKESGDINAYNATSVSLPNLEKSGNVSASNATSVSLPNLEKSGDISTYYTTSLSLPNLKESGNILTNYVTSLSLPNLEKSGNIYADNVSIISLPNLKESGDVNARNASIISLPNLKESGDVNAPSTTSLSLPNLKESVDINASNATIISLLNLKESGHIRAPSTTSLSLPNLEKSGNIYADNATIISLPNLEKSGDISASNATSISLPNLKESVDIYADNVTSISLPNLEKSGNIYADNVKNLTISSYAKSYINKLPFNTKIVKNEIKEKYSFKDFFYYKII